MVPREFGVESESMKGERGQVKVCIALKAEEVLIEKEF